MRQRRHVRRALGAVASAVVIALAASACSASSEVVIDLPPQVSSAFPDETVQQMTDAVTHAVAATGSTGAIVGVWAPWSGEWVTGFGTDGPGGAGGEVTPDLRFRAAQVTRAMTCDILYSLAAEGTVALDDPVTKYVSGVADLSAVSLEQLCDSTSGIGRYGSQLMKTWLSYPGRSWNPLELANYGLGAARTTEPGSAYRDSDAGYVLLGLALQRASGKTAAQLLAQYVTGPLDLAETTLPGASSQPTAAEMLNGYLSLKDGAGAVNCAEPLDITGLSTTTGFTDSGVVTDIRDLGRYTQALATGALMREDLGRADDALPAYNGAASWFTAAGGMLKAGSMIGQNGVVPGYATAAFADPGSGLTVAVVLNNSGAGGAPALWLAWQLAAIASKAPAGSGQTAPEAGLPWTAEQFRDAISNAAICPVP